jgi:hypothetical protein
MRDFAAAPPPCGALGLVKEGQQLHALFALRPRVQIPPAIASAGVGLGFVVLGASPHEVIHIGFQFSEVLTYHMLVNPSYPLVRTVLNTLMEPGA